MEEDIKIIKNIIYTSDGERMRYIDIDNLVDDECQNFIRAIENLIARNKDLENDNINLNDKLQMTKNSIKIANLDLMEDYIPKSKVRELREIDNIDLLQFKIKELLQEGDK